MTLLKGWQLIVIAWVCVVVAHIPGMSVDVAGLIALAGAACGILGLTLAIIDYRRREEHRVD